MESKAPKYQHAFENDFDQFKIRFFKIMLIVIFFLQSYECIRCALVSAPLHLLFSNLTGAGLTLVVFVILTRYKKFVIASIIYCSGWLVAFVFFWLQARGIDGNVSYMFFSLLVIFAVVLPRSIYPFYAVAFCLVCLFLSIYYPSGWNLPSMVSTSNQQIATAYYYLLHSAVIGFIIVVLKIKFEKERLSYNTVNEKLTALNDELSEKRAALLNQHVEVESMKSNLEEMVKDRTLELDVKNKQLSLYAYDNAHIIRGPLTNIVGILSILESNAKLSKERKHLLHKVSEKVGKLDEVVKRVNSILE